MGVSVVSWPSLINSMAPGRSSEGICAIAARTFSARCVAVTAVVILPSLIAPFAIEDGFPTNRNEAIALAALTAFAALWLLRHRDHWSLDAWLEARSRTAGE